MSPRIKQRVRGITESLARGITSYRQQPGRFQRNARLYLISNALSGVSVGIITVLYNLYLVSLGYHTDFIGLVLFTGTLGAGIAIFPAGICFDRFGGKLLLIWASVLIGIAGAGQILFHQPAPLLASTFLVGVGGAFIVVVNAPYLTANSTPAERTHLFSVNIVISLVTTVLGEILGGALPLWFQATPAFMAALPTEWAWLLARQPGPRSYQLALLFAGTIAAPSFVPLFLMSADRPGTTRAKTPTETARPSLRQRQQALVKRLRTHQPRTLLRHPLLVMIVVQALIGAGAGLFIPYFNIYFVQHLGASSALFGLIDGAANALNALLTLAAPWLAARVGKVNTIVWTRLASLPLLLAIGLTTSLPLAAALYPLRQGLMDMSLSILQVFSMEVVSRSHRGLANSSYQAVYQIVWALAASAGGVIIARLGYAPAFIAAATLYLLAIATVWGRFRS